MSACDDADARRVEQSVQRQVLATERKDTLVTVPALRKGGAPRKGESSVVRHRTQYVERIQRRPCTRPTRATGSSERALDAARPPASSRRNVRAPPPPAPSPPPSVTGTMSSSLCSRSAPTSAGPRVFTSTAQSHFRPFETARKAAGAVRQRVAGVPLEAVEVRRRAAGARVDLDLRHAELLLQIRQAA